MRGRTLERAFVFTLVLAAFGGAASAQPPSVPALPPPWQSSITPPPERDLPHDTHPFDVTPSMAWDPAQALTAAAERASPGPRRVLETSRAMIDDSTIVRGSCFDWVDAVYHRAGGHSHDVFHGRHTGPFADSTRLQPGDWVFFINHGWGDDTHSAIFIGWTDQSTQTAMMVSYAGGHRDEPGRFSDYELTGVFRIVRMTDEPPPPVHAGSAHRHPRPAASERGASRPRHPPRE